jgi:hypothetical protein
MKHTWHIAVLAALLALLLPAQAEVPLRVNYQGRVTTGGTNFTGTGLFKFALVDAAAATNIWSNDGASSGEPAVAVSLAVVRGLFAVQLGDTNLANMTALSLADLAAGDLRLRMWFSDGGPFTLLAPDQSLAAVPYALVSRSVAAEANALSVGGDQLVCISNRVGVGTAAPASTLDIAGPGGPGTYPLRVSSGGKVIAWGREK